MDNIKERNQMSKYLEDVFISQAIDVLIKQNRVSMTGEGEIAKEWLKCSLYLTRRWLNYLDNDQFEKLFSKKMEERVQSGSEKDLHGNM